MKHLPVTAQDIEIAVAEHFNSRQNLIVPNVHWGWMLQYEADMVILRQSGYAVEVEIKVSAADIKRDLRKHHQHDSLRFRRRYFAVPEWLKDDHNIPEYAGIISVKPHPNPNVYKWYAATHRECKPNKYAHRITDAQRLKLAELGAMRIWDLKAALAHRRFQHTSTTQQEGRP